MGAAFSQPGNGDDEEVPSPLPAYFHPLHLSNGLPHPTAPPWAPTSTSIDPSEPQPTAHIIHFPTSPLSASYTTHLALIIDHLFTPAECAALISLAESTGPWVPAEVDGRVAVNYRNSERIMRQDECAGEWIYERLGPWMRELGLEVLYEPRGEGEEEKEEERGRREGGEKRFGHIVPRGVRLGLAARKKMAVKSGLGKGMGKGDQEEIVIVRWDMCRVNPLLRFLKYRPGQFFHRHCDGHFLTSDLPDWDSSQPLEKSWITIQIYLSSPGLAGGATSFWGRTGKDHSTRIDVEARQGRVLIFQQRDLIHTGEKVRDGEKITVRSEFMFRKVVEKKKEEEGGR
ncbi:hypothetical protein BGX38DRAFT_1330990 [Terfezia claveryi]|nr:hypothetical protein BGX38DRAFT_1330990 [Terfezia claveryi]